MLRGVIRLPDNAPNWGGKVVTAAAWQSFVASHQENEDQPPSPTLMSPTTPAAVAKKAPEPLALGSTATVRYRPFASSEQLAPTLPSRSWTHTRGCCFRARAPGSVVQDGAGAAAAAQIESAASAVAEDAPATAADTAGSGGTGTVRPREEEPDGAEEIAPTVAAKKKKARRRY